MSDMDKAIQEMSRQIRDEIDEAIIADLTEYAMYGDEPQVGDWVALKVTQNGNSIRVGIVQDIRLREELSIIPIYDVKVSERSNDEPEWSNRVLWRKARPTEIAKAKAKEDG